MVGWEDHESWWWCVLPVHFCFFPSLALIHVFAFLYRYVGDGSNNGRIVHTTSTFPTCKVCFWICYWTLQFTFNRSLYIWWVRCTAELLLLLNQGIFQLWLAWWTDLLQDWWVMILRCLVVCFCLPLLGKEIMCYISHR